FDVEKNNENVFESYRKGNLVAFSNVGSCYKKGIGIAIDENKGVQ
ncbi:10851_t:CDS:1, partial [Diversispora eburnea]